MGPIDLDALAQVAGVSKYHFAPCFGAVYGLTPIRYLTRRRLERAGPPAGREPHPDRWATLGGPHVPGCYLFMRGVLDLPGTASPTAGSRNLEEAPGATGRIASRS